MENEIRYIALTFLYKMIPNLFKIYKLELRCWISIYLSYIMLLKGNHIFYDKSNSILKEKYLY